MLLFLAVPTLSSHFCICVRAEWRAAHHYHCHPNHATLPLDLLIYITCPACATGFPLSLLHFSVLRATNQSIKFGNPWLIVLSVTVYLSHSVNACRLSVIFSSLPLDWGCDSRMAGFSHGSRINFYNDARFFSSLQYTTFFIFSFKRAPSSPLFRNTTSISRIVVKSGLNCRFAGCWKGDSGSGWGKKKVMAV